MEKHMIVAILQARMLSTRLPGKVMLPILNRPMIGYLLERIKLSKKIQKVVLATSTDSSNDILCHYVLQQGIDVYRGSEDDVLDRFYQAATKFGAHVVVRITADCPLLDYKVADQVIECYQASHVDYCATAPDSPGYPDGLDVEVFSFQSLEEAWKKANLKSQREHVTPYIRNSESFKKIYVRPSQDYSKERWTVDNQEDFILVEKIIEHFYPLNHYFGLDEIMDYRLKNQKLFSVNQHITRNEGYTKSVQNDQKLS